MLTELLVYVIWLICSLLPWRLVLALIALHCFSLDGSVMWWPCRNLFPTRPLTCFRREVCLPKHGFN